MSLSTRESRALSLACTTVLILALAGCRGSEREGRQTIVPPHDDRPILLETVGEFAVVPLRIDGFEEMSPRERGLAFYLYRAALAGRDIHYDQMGRQNLEVRDLLEEVLLHSDGIPRSVIDPLHRYLKLFWINNGNHNDRTKRKFVPRLSFEELRAAANHATNNGANIRLALGESLDQKLERLRRTIFDPDCEPLLTCKNPPQGQDILSCSSVNYYEGLSLADLEGFTETHPLNSRLVKRRGGIAEEVYRAGRGDLPQGRYAMELQTILGFLAKARAFTDPSQSRVLEHLEEYFATGDPEAFRRYNIAWVQHDPPLDTINGFIETYKDPRSVKGAWEGIVYFVDRRASELHKLLASNARYFEDQAPWAERFKRRDFTPPLANAISVLVAVGDAGPMPPIGINLPNEESIGERYGNKSFSLVNLIDAGNRATLASMLNEFVLPDDRPMLERHGPEVTLLHTAMHEVLGHAAGKVSDDLEGDPQAHLREYYATLEEARAELVALHHIYDPKLVAIGALSSEEAAEASYRGYVVQDIYMLRRIRDGEALEDDHMRATHLIVSYLREVAGAVEHVRRNGKTHVRVVDIGAMRRAVAELLSEIQRIKGEGDLDAARALIDRFAVRIDARLRDEVVRRAEAAGLPSYLAFVMPEVIPVRDDSGEVVDARVSYPSDFTIQMLKYSGKLPLEADARTALPSGLGQ